MKSTHPLRFCMVTTFYPPYNFGGDGIFVQRLSNELARRGHSVHVIHSVDAYRVLGGEFSGGYEDHPNVSVHGLASRSSLFSTLITHQLGAPIVHLAEIQNVLGAGFDVIHYHNVSLVGGPQILRYGQGIKLYSTHEYWLICPTHVLFRYNRAPCAKPHCFLCTLSYARPPQLWRYSNLLRSAKEHVDVFTAPSRFIIEIHRQFGFDAPMTLMPYFVPETELAATKDDAAYSRVPYLLYVGRLEKLKGAHTLIPHFRDQTRVRLLIAGKGEEESFLRQLAGDSPSIRFLGHLSAEQLNSLYRNALAVIVPSLCYEGFPLVIIEAFQQQTPVLARKLGALPEIITESGGGILYETETQLAVLIKRLLQNPNLRNELGQRGYQSYKQKWTADAFMHRYFGLIEEIRQGK